MDEKRLTPCLPVVLEKLWHSYLSPGAVFVLAELYPGGLLATTIDAQQALKSLVAEEWDAALEYLMPHYSLSWNTALAHAASGGHTSTMALCASKGATDWNQALTYAAGGGHESAMALCESKGASAWDMALNWAAEGGHTNAMTLCESKGAILAPSWNMALSSAAEGGHISAMILCESKGATDWNTALAWAASGGRRRTSPRWRLGPHWYRRYARIPRRT